MVSTYSLIKRQCYTKSVLTFYGFEFWAVCDICRTGLYSYNNALSAVLTSDLQLPNILGDA